MSSGHTPNAGADFDVDDPSLTRFDLVREGARRDGVEIVHYEPRFPVPGTRVERRVVRAVAGMFLLSGLAAIGFVVAYIWLPWKYEPGLNLGKAYTPVLGLTLGLCLLLLGFGIITWAKKLFPAEISVQDRHDGASPHDERSLTGATLVNMSDELGLKRRPILLGSLLVPAGVLGVAAVAPLVGALIKSPNGADAPLLNTGWNPKNNGGKPVRLAREDGSPIRPEDVSVGGQITVFPGIARGATNVWADSPVLLFNLRIDAANTLRDNIANSPPDTKSINGMWQNMVAYSKICTHAGCPASLYEQQTHRLLCPCHQSQFKITEQAKPIFGPAHRRLPMLPLDVDEEGFLIATSDFHEAVGPAYWERPS